jgi:hypothetical protein
MLQPVADDAGALLAIDLSAIRRAPCGALEDRLVPRPLVQQPHALADGKADARPVVVAGVEHLLDRRAVLGALIDLVEAILVREDRVVRFPCLTKGRLLH